MKSLLVVLLGFGFAAQALTLKEKKKYEEWKQYVSEKSEEGHSGTVKQKCGYSIPVTIDEKMVTPFMEKNLHGAGYCDSVASAISGMCEDAMSKAEISKKIKKISCKMGKGSEYTLKLKGTELELTVGTESNNLEQQAKEFLENHL